MAQLTNRLGEAYPDWDWFDSDFYYFVEYLKARGIVVEKETHKTSTSPAISFSGFWSQGDGLAFDCDIDWPVFCATHPDMLDALPVWYLLLCCNPAYVSAGSKRDSRGNTMSVGVDHNDVDDLIEHGFFAGQSVDEVVLNSTDRELEEYLKDVLEAEASGMYKSLEKTYEAECEYLKEQEIASLREEHDELLVKALALLPETFTRREAIGLLDDADDLDFEDLDVLGLIRHIAGGVYTKEKQS